MLPIIKSSMPNGSYEVYVQDCRLNDNKIIFVFECCDNHILFEPYGITIPLNERNPLYVCLRNLGYNDDEITSLDCDDFIGTKMLVDVKTNKGKKRDFFNIQSMEILCEEAA